MEDCYPDELFHGTVIAQHFIEQKAGYTTGLTEGAKYTQDKMKYIMNTLKDMARINVIFTDDTL